MADIVLEDSEGNDIIITPSSTTDISLNDQDTPDIDLQTGVGPAGAQGADGAPGVGIPVGGTANQAYTKIDSTDYNGQWSTIDKTFVGLGNVDNTSDATKNSAAASLSNKILVSPKLSGSLGSTPGTDISITPAGTSINLNSSENSTFINGKVAATVDGIQAISNKDLTSGTNTFPTFNQNTTGSAASLTTGRTVRTNLGSTATATFDGTANIAPGVTGTLLVGNGGTGRATATTAYGLIAAGTTATGAQQTISPGTSGQFLKSAGPSALAAFSAIAQSDVTNLTTDLAAKLSNITGLVTQGTNVTITGSGTSGSPYVISSTGGGVSSLDAVTKNVAQTAHGLVVGNVVRYNGTSYVKSQADVAANSDVEGIVSAVPDANNFTLTLEGYVSGLTGLTAGTSYFLSPTTAGTLTSTAPATVGQVNYFLLKAVSTTAGYFRNHRGTVVAAASTADVSSNTATSVDSEVALFSSTTGKVIKRATGTGIATLASGVLGTVAAPTGAVVGTTDSQTLTNKLLSTGTTFANNIVPAAALSTSAITLGYAQSTANFSTAATSATLITGLSTTVTIPAGGRRVKITVYGRNIQGSVANSYLQVGIWDGTVGTGTLLGQTQVQMGIASQPFPCYVLAIPSAPAAGSKTYSASLHVAVGGGTATLESGAGYPAFILVEAI